MTVHLTRITSIPHSSSAPAPRRPGRPKSAPQSSPRLGQSPTIANPKFPPGSPRRFPMAVPRNRAFRHHRNSFRAPPVRVTPCRCPAAQSTVMPSEHLNRVRATDDNHQSHKQTNEIPQSRPLFPRPWTPACAPPHPPNGHPTGSRQAHPSPRLPCGAWPIPVASWRQCHASSLPTSRPASTPRGAMPPSGEAPIPAKAPRQAMSASRAHWVPSRRQCRQDARDGTPSGRPMTRGLLQQERAPWRGVGARGRLFAGALGGRQYEFLAREPSGGTVAEGANGRVPLMHVLVAPARGAPDHTLPQYQEMETRGMRAGGEVRRFSRIRG